MLSFIFALSVALFSTSVVANASIKWVGQQLSGPSAIAILSSGVGVGTISLVLCFSCLIKRHRESLSVELDKLKSEMRIITTEYERRQKKIKERITERMKR